MQQVSRRSFLKGAALTGAAAAGAAFMGCTPQTEDPNPPISTPQDPAPASKYKPVETIDCDVCVVGSGVSGLSAGVQAVQDGFKVLMLEASGMRSGQLWSPEGICGLDSRMAKEAGIHIEPGDIIEKDNVLFNFRLNPLFWVDMLARSGANIDWLEDLGVEFISVDNDARNNGGKGFYDFHRFPGNHECTKYYGDPMEAEFLKRGGELRLNTKGQELIFDETGKVAGLYATSDDGDIQINCKAVILATGGFCRNDEMMEEYFVGMHQGRWFTDGLVNNDGTGTKMALSAGGYVVARSILGGVGVTATKAAVPSGLGSNPNMMWVNEAGRRFTNEDVAEVCATMAAKNPVLEQVDSFTIADAAIVSFIEESNPAKFENALALAKEAATAGDTQVFMADTLDDLAKKMGFDPALFKKEVETYNGYCEAGNDKLFKKNPEKLRKIAEAPFFGFRQMCTGHGPIGGLVVNLDMQVVDRKANAIPGLYATGIESNMCYREIYTIEVPGSAMCWNIDSGRQAARHIAKTMK